MRVGFYVEVFDGASSKDVYAINLELAPPPKRTPAGCRAFRFYVDIPDEAIELPVKDLTIEDGSDS